MKNILKKISLLLTALILSSCNSNISNNVAPKMVDNTIYDIDRPITLRDMVAHKAEVGEGDNGDDEEEEIEVNKVIIHYVNEENDCRKRAFYIWGPGIKGREYSDESEANPDDVIVHYESDSHMYAVFDFADSRFAKFKDFGYIMYIVKFKKTSTSENWGGQSDDIELKFSNFEVDQDGVLTVWATPATGGGMSQYDSEEKTKVDGVKYAVFSDWRTISCQLTPKAIQVSWNLYAFDESYYKIAPKNRNLSKADYLVLSGTTSSGKFDIKLDFEARINAVYCIVSKDIYTGGDHQPTGAEKTIYVSAEKLYGTERFEKFFNYKGSDLGVTYSKDQTVFKLWSPVAGLVTLNLYTADTSAAYGGDDEVFGTYYMNYRKGGIWTLTVQGNLEGMYYDYYVDTWNGSSNAMDPYATSCGANGIRALIYDKARTNPDNWDTLPLTWDKTEKFDIKSPQDLTIYEVHIQDFTGDSSWVSSKATPTKRGTYNAFVEEGTTYSKDGVTVSTGFDHLKELGVGAVQLVPVFDSDNSETDNCTIEDNNHPERHSSFNNADYNWGYNPLNYNCVEGAYSSNPHDGYARVKEFKNMVYKLSTIGTRVIMDVVYNHVSSPSGSCFNKIMPRYFFRYDENGELYDGSGCHNEFKSESTMGRKYIVDSVSMWAREYKVKGFRFDLMGLLDVNTMKAIKKALYAIDPDIYMYGEGWTAAGFHGGIDYETKQQSKGAFCCAWETNAVYSDLHGGDNPDDGIYIGGFNDMGRNAIKGDNNPGYGFINDSYGINDDYRYKVQNVIYGGHSAKSEMDSTYDENAKVVGTNPKQTVNYVSCHDDYTLFDQLYITLNQKNSPGNLYNVMRGSLSSHALVFASNAAAFMLGGEELLRTKNLNQATAEEIEEIPVSSYGSYFNGSAVISHNSYNSPFSINTFKWGNKISVTMDNTTVKTDKNHENLTGKFASLIKLHKDMPKYSYEELYGNGSLTHSLSGANMGSFSWRGSNNHVIGYQIGQYFIYISGRNGGSIDATGVINKQCVFESGMNNKNGNTLSLGDEYGNGLSCAIYYCGGN